jgi:hypothetical protein
MKKIVLAALLVFSLIANPVIGQAMDLFEGGPSSSKIDSKIGKDAHANNHCCHSNTVTQPSGAHQTADFVAAPNSYAIALSTFRSLHESSPLLEPPAIV